MPPLSNVTPASLNHFVIFSPSLIPPKPPRPPSPPPSTVSQPNEPKDPGEQDGDLEDDLRDAAQILFYTSRQAGGVSRDRMLRQVGLVKGLMSFTGMVSTSTPMEGQEQDGKGKGEVKHWCIHSHKVRMIVLEPEEDFFIYANVVLETMSVAPVEGQTTKTKLDPTPTAQGMSDRMLVQALMRGFEDFRFQNGTFRSLLPPSPTLHTLVDKWWTRWAFSFESTYLSVPSPNPSHLDLWLGGYPSASPEIDESANRALEIYRDDANLPDAGLGILAPSGPVALDGVFAEGPLLRFLMKHLIASIPPPPPTGPEGTPKGKKEPRKASWATSTFSGLGEVMGNAVGWVPSLASTSRPATPAIPPTVPQGGSSSKAAEAKSQSIPPPKDKQKWTGLGIGSAMGGLGDAFGSMGSALGLGSSPKGKEGVPSPKTSGSINATEGANNAEATARDAAPGSSSPADTAKRKDTAPSISSSHQVLQSAVAIPDLVDATEDEQPAELHWETATVWNARDGQLAKEELTWIVRDSHLLFILGPLPHPPDRKVTLALFSKLSSIPPEPRAAQTTHTVPAPNYSVYHNGESTDIKGPSPDAATLSSLADLKNLLGAPEGVVEAFAKAQNGKFLVAKQSRPSSNGEQGEMYMVLGRKDASLTDAEAAVRGFARSHPDLAG